MSAELPRRQRSNKEVDCRPAATGDQVCWRATYTYKANSFKYTDEASIRDVSRIGCGIHARTCLQVGSKTTVTFHLQDGQRPLSVPGRVIWVSGDAFGVEFLHLSSDGYQRMEAYVRAVLSDARPDGAETPRLMKEHRRPNLRLAAVSLLVLGSVGVF